MAEGKKSFILYSDLLQTAKKLPKEKAGELFLTILEYVNDLNPDPEDVLIQIAFEPIKMQLKRDLEKWENQIAQRSQAGKKSAEQRQRPSTTVNENQRPSTTVNENQRPSTTVNENQRPSTTVESRSTNPTDNVTVTVNDSVINSAELSETEKQQAFEFVFRLGRKEITKPDITNFWEAFKTHKPESFKETRSRQMQHFRDWLKFQKKSDIKIEQPALVYNIDEQIKKYM